MRCALCGNSLRFLILLAGSIPLFAADTSELPDFANLSLDQLANIRITSFTNKEQQLAKVAGAVYVITKEQIARSGMTSVPELLRLAPGVDVARINGNQWSVSIRGPVGAYANKLLVLIDGRSVYSPIFSGVYWDVGMPLLEDIERIEVIRGPGATIWGANAVLGVINIITKSTRDTHGTTLMAAAGNTEPFQGSIRMGGVFGSTNYRAYFGGLDQAALQQPDGKSAGDGLTNVQAGFRLDGKRANDTWTLEGDLFRSTENDIGMNVSLATMSIVASPVVLEPVAGNLTAEWRRHVGEHGEFRVRSYYDYVDRPEPQATKVVSGTGDSEVQYDFLAGRINNLSVGGGIRVISEKVLAIQPFAFSPDALTYANLNTFAQDEVHLAHDSVLLTFGAKLEHNHFGGFGTEPSANLLWTPAKRQSLWLSTARALRTPSLLDDDVTGQFTVSPPTPASGGLPVVASFVLSPEFKAERVKDFEIGYRGQISKRFSLDLAAFYDQYSGNSSDVPGYPAFIFYPVPHLDVTESTANWTDATGKGIEAAVAWQVLPAWKLEGSYTYNLVDPWINGAAPPGSFDGGVKLPSRNKWRLQSYVNLSRSWKVDSFLYWTSPGDTTNSYGPPVYVPSYMRLDVRIGYNVNRRWQLSLAGQNLLQARHLEAISELLSGWSYVNRGAYLKSTWQF